MSRHERNALVELERLLGGRAAIIITFMPTNDSPWEVSSDFGGTKPRWLAQQATLLGALIDACSYVRRLALESLS